MDLSMHPGRSEYISTYRGTSLHHTGVPEQTHPPRTLQQDHASGPRGVLGGWAFSYSRGTLVLEIPPFQYTEVRKM